MCGRYATSQTSASLHQAFEIDLANSFVELEADDDGWRLVRWDAGRE